MANFSDVFDACVLYPAPLRDLLIHLAQTDQFRAKWSEQIHIEWMRNLLRNRPDLAEEKLQRTVELMNQAVPDCLVKNYEDLIPSLQLPDPKDRHVLAIAMKTQADVIVTNNLKDFPQEILAKHQIEAQTPDIFLNHLFDLNPTAFCQAVKQQRARLQNPAYTAVDLLEVLYRQGLPLTVVRLRTVIELI